MALEIARHHPGQLGPQIEQLQSATQHFQLGRRGGVGHLQPQGETVEQHVGFLDEKVYFCIVNERQKRIKHDG
jgi:hypothetical protein